MRKPLLPAAVLLLVALPASAAIQYEFFQRSSSDDSGVRASDLSARAIVDGDRSRVDFISGNVYPPGTYMISTDGARRLYFIDPAKKWYTEVNTAGVASAIGSSSIKIENLKSQVDRLPDGQVIAGIETEHYQLTIDYDITVQPKAMPLKQHVRTIIDQWVTLQFGDTRGAAMYNSSRTGNKSIDELIEAETGKIKGLPLRQTITITTMKDLPSAKKTSELKLPRTRTIVREMWITRIQETAPSPTSFTIPATYRRADQPDLSKGSSTQVLTMEPSGK
jgi:hypothetical protein